MIPFISTLNLNFRGKWCVPRPVFYSYKLRLLTFYLYVFISFQETHDCLMKYDAIFRFGVIFIITFSSIICLLSDQLKESPI